MTPEARKYYQKRLNELLNSEEGLKKDVPLPRNTKYDDLFQGIDFDKALEEYRNFDEE